jgi:hypothetical protein
MVYKPSIKSFVNGLPYDLSPLGSAALVMYFVGSSAGFLFKVLSGGMVLFSVLLVLNSLMVHLKRLYVNEIGIGIRSFGARTAIPWTDISSVVLRERQNAITRTDRLLIIESPQIAFGYVISTLSPNQEEEVLAAVRAKTQVVVYQDQQAI